MRNSFATIVAVLLLAQIPVRAVAQEDPPSPQAIEPAKLERLLYDHLRDANNRGADLYNLGDPLSSYRLFEGTLITVKAVLQHRADVQATITEAMTDVSRSTSVSQRAYRMHEAIVKVRDQLKPMDVVAPPKLIVPKPAMKDPPKPQTLPITPPEMLPIPHPERELLPTPRPVRF